MTASVRGAERREPRERRGGVRRVRHVVGERARSCPNWIASRARADDAVLDQRLGIARLEEEIGAEERALGLVEEEARVPAVRHVRRREEAEPMAADRQHLVVGERRGGAVGEVLQHDHVADEAAERLRPRRRRRATRSSAPHSSGSKWL